MANSRIKNLLQDEIHAFKQLKATDNESQIADRFLIIKALFGDFEENKAGLAFYKDAYDLVATAVSDLEEFMEIKAEDQDWLLLKTEALERLTQKITKAFEMLPPAVL